MRKGFLLFLMATASTGACVAGALAQELPAQPIPATSGSAPPPAPYPPPYPPPPPMQPGPVYAAGPAPVYEPLNVWFEADYLLWWTKTARVQPLVTGFVPADAGVLGPGDYTLLYSGGNSGDDIRSGGRFGLGFWFQDSHTLGMEATYFFLGKDRNALADGALDANIAGAPPGTFFVTADSLLQSAEVNGLGRLVDEAGFRLDFIGGFRYLQLDERLSVEQDFPWPDFSQLDVWHDEFQTHNRFYGGQVGARGEWMYERLFVNATAKVALGVSQQRVDINGGLAQAMATSGFDQFGNLVQNVTVVHSAIGGLLANPASFRRNLFAVVPEIGLNVGYQLTSYCRLSMGYSFLYWSSVARPGDQIGGTPKSTDFWAQGLAFNLGLSF